jgi:hypothetical protein
VLLFDVAAAVLELVHLLVPALQGLIALALGIERVVGGAQALVLADLDKLGVHEMGRHGVRTLLAVKELGQAPENFRAILYELLEKAGVAAELAGLAGRNLAFACCLHPVANERAGSADLVGPGLRAERAHHKMEELRLAQTGKLFDLAEGRLIEKRRGCPGQGDKARPLLEVRHGVGIDCRPVGDVSPLRGDREVEGRSSQLLARLDHCSTSCGRSTR